MGAPSDDAVMRSSERRGPAKARAWPDGANSAWSTKAPVSAPIWEPMVAPVMVAPSSEMPPGSRAPPTAAPAAASARVAIGG